MNCILLTIARLRCFGFFLGCYSIVFCPATEASQNTPRNQTQGQRGKITLRGCLGNSGGDHLGFATAAGGYLLTGETTGLEKYAEREVILEGSRDEDIPVEGFVEPFASFRVERLVKVIEKAEPELSKTFANQAEWQEERNKEYGVKFAHPADAKAVAVSELQVGSNFATQEGSEIIQSFDIPATTYANANFRGGQFTIFANRQITNEPSCRQFGTLGPQEKPPVSLRVGKLDYIEATGGSGGMGSYARDYYFHIFRQGRCYEIAFELWTYNARNADTGCNVPLLSGEDEMNMVMPLLARVAFFRPMIRRFHAADLKVIPQISEFAASSDTADDVINRGVIKFSWATEDADYVEFTYTCDDPEEAEEGSVSSVVISENGPNRYCQNIPSFARYGTGHFYRAPNGSADLGFGYFDHEDPTTILVTITPFAHAVAFPASSKSVRVTIHPYNPFQRGVPTETRNMNIAYQPETGNGYEQGSQLTIFWTDEREQDPCVNLYLVQDNAHGGENFILQLNLKRDTGCLRPAKRGSYTWNVTTKYVGTGFRISAQSPGGFSRGLGEPFSIVRPATGLPQ